MAKDNGLRPTDLGNFEAADDELEDDTGQRLNDDGLRVGEIPPKPLDMRSKEGRAWKKLYGGEQIGAGSGEPVRLFESETTSKTRAKPKKNVEHIKKILVSVHEKAALMLGNEDLEIDDEEAGLLAESGAALLEYYKIKIDGKRGAMLAFLYALTLVYGPRIFSQVVKMRAETAPVTNNGQQADNDSGNVTRFPV